MSGNSVGSIGLNNIRKKLYEDIKIGAQNANIFLRNAMTFNSTEIGNRLSSGQIHKTSSSAAASL